MDRFDLINFLIEMFGYTSYLEIGVCNPEKCFNKVKADFKVAVDPAPAILQDNIFQMTSDEFFKRNTQMFDIVFVDGLHHDDQVERDILNSLNFLTPNGTIVVHDCNPLDEDHQRVPSVVAFWCGTVWKAWVKLRQELHDVEMFIISTDTGVGIIRRFEGASRLEPITEPLTFQNLDMHREKWLNIVSVDDFKNWVQQRSGPPTPC